MRALLEQQLSTPGLASPELMISRTGATVGRLPGFKLHTSAWRSSNDYTMSFNCIFSFLDLSGQLLYLHV